ncbi:acyl-CoA thioesterase [Ornithinimicrobium avium]|uniref:Acyl-CoA thioesterase n=1 Tax=Ornithinimicrobium avium TaxID=2283195 RepID=A0A345NK81_9MICO|nr:hotdog domain-containing protein [Ornithinimicrobium avium]AXH95439.1 acyl-CoA thioesterase [Ornithinimicrobium avium]
MRDPEITLRFLAAPTDAGRSGSVGAGRVLEWIDKAGYAAAARWSGGYTVTAYVGNVRFRRPVEVGHLVEARARVILTGRSSMHITVQVSSGPPTTGGLEPATQCLMIFVAVGEDGRPTPVPTLEPRSMEERLLADWAERRKDLRGQVQAAMEQQTYSAVGTAPREVLRFLAAPTDVNWGGKVHGGIVMRWIDEAAHVLVTRWTHNPLNVAVFTGGVRFYQPLRIGDLVEVEARLLHTGPHAVHVGVHVRSGDPATGRLELTTFCRTVFVVLDEERRAATVPRWEPVSEEDRALDDHAVELVAIRERFGE